MSVTGFIINGATKKYDYNGLDNKPSQTGGLTDDLKSALLQLASKVAYSDSNGTTYYQALYDALYAVPTGYHAINNNLVGCTSSNNATSIADGESYSATITAGNGYILTGATISITMNGNSVSGAYNNGTISIASVTGDLVISITAVPLVLSSITAVYTQSGTVYTTDSLDSLKSDLVVTGTYSDSSTSVIQSSAYSLTGILTAGTSTITVTYNSKTTTFNVTVTEVSGTYTIDINGLTNCTSSNSATTVTGGASYSTTITANTGYTLTGATVSITMGSTDITSTAYSNGVISIASVTGNVVIAITAVVYNTAPSIAEDGKYINSDGEIAVKEGLCYTNPYVCTIDIEGLKASTRYDNENNYMNTSGSIFRIRYCIPNSQSIATSAKQKLVLKSATDEKISYAACTTSSGGSTSVWQDTYKKTEYLTNGTTYKFIFSLFSADVNDSYAYFDLSLSGVMPVGVEDGDIIFAGSNTPYYGLHNISEAST